MAIEIEARIEPYVTEIARIPQLCPNNDPSVDSNWDEYGRKRLRITQIRHRIVGFWPNLDLDNSRNKQT